MQTVMEGGNLIIREEKNGEQGLVCDLGALVSWQALLGTAQLCQQRRTEEDGRPHLFGSLPRKAAVLRGTRDKDILPFPPGRTACAPQKRQARRHIRKARHGPQAHIAAEHRRCKQRQHAVFRRRDAHCTVQRAAAHHHDPVFHKCSPHFAKDTPRYAK